MINDENETYPADVGNPEPVRRVRLSGVGSQREHRQPRSELPGTAGDQPATEQPSARCCCRRPASRALIAMRLTPPSLHFTVNYRNKTTAFLVEDTHCDTRHALSTLPCPWGDHIRYTRSEPLTWSQQPDDITQRARAEEGAWAPDLPRPQALLLGQISASHPAHRLISASSYAM
ncbi:unnamed protein product [Pleuronectes platessa]|uniref:Uncharacterized protein n=1 Tax=Pleuronectes platessa TaxID=8262 RepID=A0A9N7ULP1_PLEPL|nr:unnamed protein product [Pleuronectes platessa]